MNFEKLRALYGNKVSKIFSIREDIVLYTGETNKILIENKTIDIGTSRIVRARLNHDIAILSTENEYRYIGDKILMVHIKNGDMINVNRYCTVTIDHRITSLMAVYKNIDKKKIIIVNNKLQTIDELELENEGYDELRGAHINKNTIELSVLSWNGKSYKNKVEINRRKYIGY